MSDQPGGEIILYQHGDAPAIDVRLDGDTVWLSQQQLADLFGTTQQNVSLHLKNIYEEGELDETATHKDFLSVRREGAREVQRGVAPAIDTPFDGTPSGGARKQLVGNSDRFALQGG